MARISFDETNSGLTGTVLVPDTHASQASSGLTNGKAYICFVEDDLNMTGAAMTEADMATNNSGQMGRVIAEILSATSDAYANTATTPAYWSISTGGLQKQSDGTVKQTFSFSVQYDAPALTVTDETT